MPEKKKRAAAEPDWASDSNPRDVFLIPQDPENNNDQARIRQLLKNRDTALAACNIPRGFQEIRATGLGFTAFYYVSGLGEQAKRFFASKAVGEVVIAYEIGQRSTTKRDASDKTPDNGFSLYHRKREDEEWSESGSEKDGNNNIRSPSDETAAVFNGTDAHLDRLLKRDIAADSDTNWHLSQISTPRGINFNDEDSLTKHSPNIADPSQGKFFWSFEDSLGRGQTIYIVEAGWMSASSEYAHVNPRALPFQTWGPAFAPSTANDEHGYLVANYAVGKTVGVAKNANLVHVPVKVKTTPVVGTESMIAAFVSIANDLVGKARDTAVVNISAGINRSNQYDPLILELMTLLMRKMEADLGVAFVAAAGNAPTVVDTIPQLLSGDMAGMLVVGATKPDGHAWEDSSFGSIVDAWAPGYLLPLPQANFLTTDPFKKDGTAVGTSFAAPQVAGLIAYLRGFSNYPGDKSPAAIKNVIVHIERRLSYSPEGENSDRPAQMIYNGQLRPGSNCGEPGAKRNLFGRQACPLPGGGGGGGGGPGTGPSRFGPPVVYRPGPAGPLCTEICGKLCSGYYCSPTPTGTPPDFLPPGTEPTPTAPPGQVCLSSTTTTVCNGGPRGDVCHETMACASFGTGPPITTPTTTSTSSGLPGLPDLPDLPPEEEPPYSGDGCASYSTTVRCNGSGGGQAACLTQALCVPTQPCVPTFAASGTPVCTDSEYPLCIRTVVRTRCARVIATPLLARDALPTATPTITSGFLAIRSPSPLSSPSLEAKPDPDSDSDSDSKVIEEEEEENEKRNDKEKNQTLSQPCEFQSPNPSGPAALFPRQEACGSANGGCDYLLFCDLCAKQEFVPCLDSHISAYTGPFEGTDVVATVKEDGVEVCNAQIHCGIWDNDCNGIADYDCGDSYRITWRWDQDV
ncbi:uncharacterized protein BP5553_01205 [Venustampulla echinocandica]|uniref:Peptidase S8/S53 domain-containing protein n=1 Tax=Venustampulla echinocandica TaxID=2656787 RepID=A0A370U0C4_9HELO|nr:uncharacterized protein BP5553_01205 [Venustampulla echinocandica]RDL41226.1 hypothetical protein BP5553_01205 [Venustampulla echinocandica]